MRRVYETQTSVKKYVQICYLTKKTRINQELTENSSINGSNSQSNLTTERNSGFCKSLEQVIFVQAASLFSHSSANWLNNYLLAVLRFSAPLALKHRPTLYGWMPWFDSQCRLATKRIIVFCVASQKMFVLFTQPSGLICIWKGKNPHIRFVIMWKWNIIVKK